MPGKVSLDPIDELTQQFMVMCQGATALEAYYKEGCELIRKDPKIAAKTFSLNSEQARTPDAKLYASVLLGAALMAMAYQRTGAMKWPTP